MICGRCGNGNDEGSRFCTACGSPLTAPAPAADPLADAPTISMQPVQPAYPAQSVPSQSSPVQPATRRRTGTIVAIVIAAIAAVALIITGVTLAVRHVSADDPGTSQTPTPPGGEASSPGEASDEIDPTSSEESEADGDGAGTSARTLDQESTDRIVDAYSSTDVAVSVMTEDGLRSYSSRNASKRMVSAGLYLPVYLAYYGTHEGQPSDSAGEMMRSMSNEAANLLIDAVGGVDAIDSWLSANHFSGSSFERRFGDVAASEDGYENYASSDDAARMLSMVAADGADELMSYDIASEGVRIPEGATIHAHRGMGIQDAYNYFVVISDGRTKVALAVMTENLGQERAADLTSQMLATVWDTMFAGAAR